MKVSGFTFVRNAIKFDYPIVEAIRSILPVCDELVVAVGNSDDDTLGLIRSIGDPKIKIIETVWDDSLREGGAVLAVETNKALDAVSPESDWCYYIQGDEVFHEKDLPVIKAAMEKYLHDAKTEGLVFEHINFYGTYDYLATARNWDKREVRVIRNDKKIRSWKDAMSFRKNGEKLHCRYVPATIYHYGWVKHPKTQQLKRLEFEKLWHDDNNVKERVEAGEVFDYSKIDSLELFKGTHPAVMKTRIDSVNWNLGTDPLKRKQKIKLKYRILNYLESLTGLEIGRFKNYELLSE
jgi:glycosyltransferase involved in cell wall biosynthesis